MKAIKIALAFVSAYYGFSPFAETALRTETYPLGFELFAEDQTAVRSDSRRANRATDEATINTCEE